LIEGTGIIEPLTFSFLSKEAIVYFMDLRENDENSVDAALRDEK
jgi:hypothetical protein